MKVVILAGGYGKRLRPLTESLPKSLLPVAGRSILAWQIKWLKHYGFTDIVLCVGYLWEKVKAEIGDGSKYGVEVTYVIESEPLGTGGALMNARRELEDAEMFIVINGDILTNLDLRRLPTSIEKFVGAIALIPLPSPFGIVDFEEDTLTIRSFIEKPMIKDYWINAGAYIFTKEVFTYLPYKGDIERTSFPKMAEEGRLRAILFPDVFWMSIDSHKDLEEASKIIKDIYPFNKAE
ncbi:MAG: nucleotidyltransferase family protein [Aigarchaeota archaeon]|nr:nucleotidyltransferase family protein [Aigarchaeota archaeon]MCX8192217.1 nucleotidyltransferase family protein [Nitrososphaeria archaeon]MDW7986175.1 nucleotidyltransferase family protein [Nitrososphaerota archaeon]